MGCVRLELARKGAGLEGREKGIQRYFADADSSAQCRDSLHPSDEPLLNFDRGKRQTQSANIALIDTGLINCVLRLGKYLLFGVGGFHENDAKVGQHNPLLS